MLVNKVEIGLYIIFYVGVMKKVGFCGKFMSKARKYDKKLLLFNMNKINNY